MQERANRAFAQNRAKPLDYSVKKIDRLFVLRKDVNPGHADGAGPDEAGGEGRFPLRRLAEYDDDAYVLVFPEQLCQAGAFENAVQGRGCDPGKIDPGHGKVSGKQFSRWCQLGRNPE
jgi:hypothetical protein